MAYSPEEYIPQVGLKLIVDKALELGFRFIENVGIKKGVIAYHAHKQTTEALDNGVQPVVVTDLSQLESSDINAVLLPAYVASIGARTTDQRVTNTYEADAILGLYLK